MKLPVLRLTTLVAALLAWLSTDAHVDAHGDVKIEIQAVDDTLDVVLDVHTSVFGEPIFELPPATQLPGVDAIGGITTANDVALEIIGPLLFSTGMTGGSVQSTDGMLEIIAPSGIDSVIADETTATLPALDWLPLGGQLTDVHGTYALVDRGADPPGAYGLQVRAISPDFTASDPFLIVIGSHDLDPGLLGEAADQILAASVLASTPLPGDANGDDVVDGLDYLVWAAHYGDDPPADPPGSPANGDLNDDGAVNGLDYILWAGHFGESQTAAVPEPASLVTFILASATLSLKRRRHACSTTPTT